MFHKLQVLTAVEATALKIKEEIVSGNLAKGSKLPPERELAEKLGVGRSTVREAIQMLKIMGLLTVKGGGKGGAFVKETNISGVTSIIELMFELELAEWKDVLEVRLAVEPFTNKLAALNRTPEDLDAIFEVLQQSKNAFNDFAEFASLNTQFHVKLAESSHNKLLISLIHAISRLISKNGYELIIEQRDFSDVYNDHINMYSAIKDQELDRVVKLTEQHLHFAEEEYHKKFHV